MRLSKTGLYAGEQPKSDVEKIGLHSLSTLFHTNPVAEPAPQPIIDGQEHIPDKSTSRRLVYLRLEILLRGIS
jgi:hypothetical protein